MMEFYCPIHVLSLQYVTLLKVILWDANQLARDLNILFEMVKKKKEEKNWPQNWRATF